ncbi:MAG: hypothetical protein OIN86_09880 [Candidatus Methanoperedens sp.]|nr:hypothetical protein [Candidatus Methanoperedens sp.]CAG0982032.1 hypothetical protein METP1_01828 [Methanosarcinales archaeon]
MENNQFKCKIDGHKMSLRVVNGGSGRCYAIHGYADCRTCGRLEEVST